MVIAMTERGRKAQAKAEAGKRTQTLESPKNINLKRNSTKSEKITILYTILRYVTILWGVWLS